MRVFDDRLVAGHPSHPARHRVRPAHGQGDEGCPLQPGHPRTNTVALRIRHGDRDFTDMLETVERAAALLEETEAAARGMRSDMATLTGRPALFL